MASRRSFWSILGRATVLLGVLLPLAGCSRDEVRSEAAVGQQLMGVYRVTGSTVEVDTGVTREIGGLVVLQQEGDQYRTSFELATRFDGGKENPGMSAEVIGEGLGVVDGESLRGSATTQFVLSTIPGVDARFPFLPRQVGPRVTSSTKAKLRKDGALSIEIESQPAPGEVYRPTRTTLIGQRVGDVGSPAAQLPSVASGPPPVDDRR